MHLTILIDNRSAADLESEHGLCLLVETKMHLYNRGGDKCLKLLIDSFFSIPFFSLSLRH